MPDLSAVTSAPATTHSRPRAAGPVATRPRRRSDDPLLIGRERELDELDELLRQDAANGTFVLIQGEFGTGRTALLREALGWARSDGDTVLSAWADLSEQGWNSASPASSSSRPWAPPASPAPRSPDRRGSPPNSSGPTAPRPRPRPPTTRPPPRRPGCTG
ncbi:ATP-binding protein [Kitasatospora aburaviensis]